MPASRQASCSQATSKKRTFHVLIQPDISSGISDFNFIFAQNHMAVALSCQAPIALATVG